MNHPSILHEKAWGHRWPQHTGTILRTDIVPDDDLMDLDQDVTVVGDDIPERLDYVCLEGMQYVAQVLGLLTRVEDILVVRREYIMLLDALSKVPLRHQTTGIVVTGQPGIGKTAFLLYLLLYRLEHKLPTAFQCGPLNYIIFDEQGAKTVALNDLDDRLAECWALVDSNANVTQPCYAFAVLPRIVIQASSPKPARWKEWLKQLLGTCVVSDLPDMLEIAAILKELNHEPSSAFSLVNKWGPSIQTVIKVVRNPNERSLEAAASKAADYICTNPFSFSVLKQEVKSEVSDLLFIRPHRPLGFTDIESSSLGTLFIPTNYLDNIFQIFCNHLSNEKLLELFRVFSPHSLTRAIAGRGHEIDMHRRLCRDGEALSISRADSADGHVHSMRPSTNLLPGTAGGLKRAVLYTPFYWMPSLVNFPGVDSVLGDSDGNIYVLQATTADEHGSPVQEGFKSIWGTVDKSLRDSGVWRFVVVAEAKSTADTHVAVFSKELKDVTFGRQKKHIEAWGCVLRPFFGRNAMCANR